MAHAKVMPASAAAAAADDAIIVLYRSGRRALLGGCASGRPSQLCPTAMRALGRGARSVVRAYRLLLHLHLTINERPTAPNTAVAADLQRARVAVLFSGGIDCGLSALSRFAHTPEQPLDLINVAFGAIAAEATG